MTRSNFLKLALGAAAMPVSLVGRAAPSAPQNLSQKIARAKAEVQLQLDYHLIGGCVFCSTEHPEPIAMGTRLHTPERKEPRWFAFINGPDCGDAASAGGPAPRPSPAQSESPLL